MNLLMSSALSLWNSRAWYGLCYFSPCPQKKQSTTFNELADVLCFKPVEQPCLVWSVLFLPLPPKEAKYYLQ